MAKMICVAIFDSAVESFMPPIFVRAVGEGLRLFTDEVNKAEEGNLLNKHPDDYTLHYLGDFDTVEGSFNAEEKRVLMRGKDAKRE